MILEVKRIGGRQAPHDVRLRGLVDIDWAPIRRLRDTEHSDYLIGGPEPFFRDGSSLGAKVWMGRIFSACDDELLVQLEQV